MFYLIPIVRIWLYPCFNGRRYDEVTDRLQHCCTRRNECDCVFELILTIAQQLNMKTSCTAIVNNFRHHLLLVLLYCFSVKRAVGQIPSPGQLAAGKLASGCLQLLALYARFCVIPGFWPRWALSWPESCVAVPATLVFGLG